MTTTAIAFLGILLGNVANTPTVISPDGKVAVQVNCSEKGELTYTVSLKNTVVLEPSPLGLETEHSSWTNGLTIVNIIKPEAVTNEYRLIHGKRSICRYSANRCEVLVRNAKDQKLRIVFQVSNDGVAFRYELPECAGRKTVKVTSEITGFDFSKQTRAWLMPMDEGQSGWCRVNPCYEQYYTMNTSVTTPSPIGVGWAFPALFRVNEKCWVLIADSNLTGNYCGVRLDSPTNEGLYRIGFPDPRENNNIGDVNPTVAVPFFSPWRVIICGKSLGTIIESTLVTDLADTCKVADQTFVQPGKATWSWLREKDGATVFDRQKAYIDLAAKLGFEYCLVDGLWDVQIGYEKIAELIRYAAAKNVGILLWYNTNGNWNDAPQTPKNRMNTHKARVEEFARIRKLGVKGVKVDFFGGEKQVTMQLYMDLLKDAADHGMMVNCHGATIPRGWERNWPNLVTMESVRGYENYTFRQEDADRAPSHCCMVPFTRNVIGPMDFTPTCLGKYLDNNRTVLRRTSDAFELALAVIYESGIQHFGVTPDDIKHTPAFAVDLLRSLPPTWDDIRWIDGFPGIYIVLARRSGSQWFIAGINGQDQPQEVTCDLNFIGQPGQAKLIQDNSDGKGLTYRELDQIENNTLKLSLLPHAGFVFRCEGEAQK